MSEKTPRQLGKEVEMFRSLNHDAEGRLLRASLDVDNLQDQADYFGRVAAGDDVESLKAEKEWWAGYAPASREQARELSREALKLVADEYQPIVYERATERAKYTREAAEHYEQNAAGYHDLAVLEAAMDGVPINVRQSKAAKEHTQAE
ncbi:MAG: hypothetical protein ACHQTE_01485 [Candidatus Saccharimonadales bacterium]